MSKFTAELHGDSSVLVTEWAGLFRRRPIRQVIVTAWRNDFKAKSENRNNLRDIHRDAPLIDGAKGWYWRWGNSNSDNLTVWSSNIKLDRFLDGWNKKRLRKGQKLKTKLNRLEAAKKEPWISVDSIPQARIIRSDLSRAKK